MVIGSSKEATAEARSATGKSEKQATGTKSLKRQKVSSLDER